MNTSFREAKIEDIEQLHLVRTAVLENRLSDPQLITYDDYVQFLTVRGKGWVCEIEEQIVGFAIADLKEENIWALFLLPDFEGNGIGKQLQQLMLDWYFSMGKHMVWLGTAPGTRAAKFYSKSGWKEVGRNGEKELRFEMKNTDWIKTSQ